MSHQNYAMHARDDGADYVLVSSPRPRVRLITLNNPERLNAMSFPLVESLYAALRRVAADNDCMVAILTGSGRGFCSGMDLTDVGMPPGSDGLPISRIAIRAMAFMSDVVPAMRAIPQPLICAVNGPSYGGGMCIPLGADIRIAARSATFRGAGINNGLAGTECGVSYLLPRLIGASRANEIILSGREVDADEAERIGLVSRVVDDAELVDCALEMADRMCGYSAHGLSMTKEVLWANLEAGSLKAAIDLENRNQLLVRMTTQNLDEAIRARKHGRPPVYED
ncbi:MAG TPA: enoyl-CoA hydratase-related protein [Candidatus Limnocylindrales bacterium]|nr:enoyl-CoA hydratase-related protein [Candidatus Limnocylindrales bacterium]